MIGFATQVTRIVPTTVWPDVFIPPTEAQLTPVAGSGTESRRVWGATISNLTGSAVHFAVAAYPQTGVFWAALLAPNSTIVVPIPFVTNSGLAVTTTTASAIAFTFFHSQIT